MAVLMLGLVLGVGSAQSANLHGIAFAKTCEDPTTVGAPLRCFFGVTNFDTGHNLQRRPGRLQLEPPERDRPGRDARRVPAGDRHVDQRHRRDSHQGGDHRP